MTAKELLIQMALGTATKSMLLRIIFGFSSTFTLPKRGEALRRLLRGSG